MLEIFQQTIATPITFEGLAFIRVKKRKSQFIRDKKTKELYSEEQISEEII